MLPDDRDWASGIIDELVLWVKNRLGKPDEARHLDDAVAAVTRPTPTVTVGRTALDRIGQLKRSDPEVERVAAWQLDVATLHHRTDRRRLTLTSLGDDDTVRRAAVLVLEREWAGDEEVFTALLGALSAEQEHAMRELLVDVLDRGWPGRLEVPRLAVRRAVLVPPVPAAGPPRAHVIGGTGGARSRARAGSDGQEGAQALDPGFGRPRPGEPGGGGRPRGGLGHLADTVPFLLDEAGRRADLPPLPAVIRAVVALDEEATFDWLTSGAHT